MLELYTPELVNTVIFRDCLVIVITPLHGFIMWSHLIWIYWQKARSNCPEITQKSKSFPKKKKLPEYFTVYQQAPRESTELIPLPQTM